MAFTREEIAGIYARRAALYDLSSRLYLLLGFSEERYRRLAVSALGPRRGGTVVDLGCGTGKNFGLLRAAVGEEGRIIGVDLTPEMLNQARKKIERRGWKNVELVRSDMAEFRFPERVDGIISTYAITLVPEYDLLIKRGAEALSPGGRFVILDFKEPDWPAWLVRFFVFLMRPFGVTLDLTERRPWESLERRMDRTELREYYFGGVYICEGHAL